MADQRYEGFDFPTGAQEFNPSVMHGPYPLNGPASNRATGYPSDSVLRPPLDLSQPYPESPQTDSATPSPPPSVPPPTSGEVIYFPFKISVGESGGSPTIEVAAGEITNNGSNLTSATTSDSLAAFSATLSPGTNYAYVKVTRNSSTRVVSSSVVGVTTNIGDLAGSETEQFILLGYVQFDGTTASQPTQNWFGDIHNFETFGSIGSNWYYHYFVSAAGNVIPFSPPLAP